MALTSVPHIHVDIAKDWLSVTDIETYMSVSEFVVTSLLRSGAVPAVKIGREWRVARQDFENWINSQRGAVSETVTAQPAAVT